MGGRGKKSAKGARSKSKRVAKVACIEDSRQQLIADPWIGLRYVRSFVRPAVELIHPWFHLVGRSNRRGFSIVHMKNVVYWCG